MMSSFGQMSKAVKAAVAVASVLVLSLAGSGQAVQPVDGEASLEPRNAREAYVVLASSKGRFNGTVRRVAEAEESSTDDASVGGTSIGSLRTLAGTSDAEATQSDAEATQSDAEAARSDADAETVDADASESTEAAESEVSFVHHVPVLGYFFPGEDEGAKEAAEADATTADADSVAAEADVESVAIAKAETQPEPAARPAEEAPTTAADTTAAAKEKTANLVAATSTRDAGPAVLSLSEITERTRQAAESSQADAEVSQAETDVVEAEVAQDGDSDSSFASKVPGLGFFFKGDRDDTPEPVEIAKADATPAARTGESWPVVVARAGSSKRPATTQASEASQVQVAARPTPQPDPVPERRVPEPVQVSKRPQDTATAEVTGTATRVVDRGVSKNPARPHSMAAGGRAHIMRVLTGKSLVIDLKTDAKRVAVANPEIAEVMIISPRQVMVNGLAEGETSIIIWDKKGNYTMHSLVSGETLQDQVMLEVTVAEINRTAMERHGMDVRSFGGQFGGVSQYGNAAPLGGQHPPEPGQPMFPFGLDGGLSWAIVDTKNNIAAMFRQIQDENLGRILAEPKLLTRSGKEANFLSGGEIPIVITEQDDTTIEFKEFGTKIDFVPRVREDGMIDLQVASEVSEPDFAGGVELFGFQVPSFITRRVDTNVSLEDGQSLIIAGLMKETKQEIESKMPFVGDIPFLGYLFRSTEYQNDTLELIMVVRPRLVDSVPADTRVALPTDRGPLTREEVRTKPVDEKVSRPRPW